MRHDKADHSIFTRMPLDTILLLQREHRRGLDAEFRVATVVKADIGGNKMEMKINNIRCKHCKELVKPVKNLAWISWVNNWFCPKCDRLLVHGKREG